MIQPNSDSKPLKLTLTLTRDFVFFFSHMQIHTLKDS